MAAAFTSTNALWLFFIVFLRLVQEAPARPHHVDTLPAKTRTLSGSSAQPRSFSVGVAFNRHFKPNGPAQHLRALTKWGVDIPTQLADFVSNKDPITNVPAHNETDDKEYLSIVKIGNPAQEVHLDFDSGSSDLWVFSSETSTFGDLSPTRRIWKPELSKTATKLNDSRWSIIYGDGSYATGNVYKDDVTLGNIFVQGAIVESATSVSSSMESDASMSGLLGLAYKQPSQVTPSQPTFLQQLSPILGQAVFTVDLRYHASGSYDFGGIDHSKHVGNITWVPLSDGALFWEFDFASFNVGNTPVWLLSTWPAILDTGTTLILLPHDLAAAYYAEVPAASFNESYAAWVFPCGTHLPDFHLGFAGGSGSGGGNGWYAKVPGRYIEYTAADDDATQCYGGIQENGGIEFSILGDVFLKALFAIFDVDGGRLGFADKVLDA